LATLTDDEVAQVLVVQTADAYRLAAWILRDAGCAEDAVQEAAMAAWDARNKMRYADDPAAWFKKVVVNTCRDELRRLGRRQRIPLPRTLVDAGRFERSFCVREELEQAIERLTSEEQVIIALRYGRDLTIPQIALLTGIAQGTAKSRLHHALEHLRAALAAERRIEERVQ
jgi:RNA polymerase sigma-70 factor (ECF subfamily)